MQTVDILLPTYNGGRYVEEQIRSLLAQSHKEIKIFIRDDGSSDETCRIVADLADENARIILIADAKGNLGLVNNIDLLMGFSTSNYLMYCDQDDVWLPEKVKITLGELIKAEQKLGKNTPILVHSDAYVTDSNLIGKQLFKGRAPFKYGLKNALFRYYVQGASCLFNRSLKDQIHPFIGDIYLHDRYTHLMAEIVGHRIYIDQPLMYYRQHSLNLVGSTSVVQKIKNNLNLSKLNFYLEPDRLLIKQLFEKKFKDNKLLAVYLKITSRETTKFQKIRLLIEHRISIRMKDLMVLLIKKQIVCAE